MKAEVEVTALSLLPSQVHADARQGWSSQLHDVAPLCDFLGAMFTKVREVTISIFGSLVSAETECRSQAKCEVCRSIHRFHEMTWDLLRSHSFFLHSYILFQSRESGQTLALTFCRGEWFKDVRSIHDQLQQPHRTDKIALVVLQGRSVVENKWMFFSAVSFNAKIGCLGTFSPIPPKIAM